MPELSNTITALNEILSEALDVKDIAVKFYGLAELIPYDDTHDTPMLLVNKDATEAVFDDRYMLTAYHRNLSVSYDDLANDNTFGDEVGKRETANMLLVVWCDPVQMKKDRYRVRDLIAMKINNIITPAVDGILSVNVGGTGLQLNQKDLFNQEYNGFSYCVKAEQLLFAVQYQIITDYDAACYTICNDC